MQEAKFYKKQDNRSVICHLCPHECRIPDGGTGICRARINGEGILYAATYGETVTISLDPIEKKPLYHFKPGSRVLSIGHNACNLSCLFCQNYSISQRECPSHHLEPEDIVALCIREKSPAVAFTYTEPLTWYEFVLDCSKALHEAGFASILVTNGYINPEPLEELLPYVDAMNVDLKSMSDEFYRRICGGTLEPVKRTIEYAASRCLVEVTNLIITGENDTEKDIRELVDFVAGIDENIPLHFSRYYPTYKMTNPPTPVATLEMAYRIAKEKLHNVYLGNIISETRSNTYCPNCGELLINRSGYHVSVEKMDDSRCSNCGTTIRGIWK